MVSDFVVEGYGYLKDDKSEARLLECCKPKLALTQHDTGIQYLHV